MTQQSSRFTGSIPDYYDRHLGPRIFHDFADDPPGFYRVPFAYHEAEVIEADLNAAGFDQVNIESLDLVSTIPSVDDFATGLVFGNPLFEEVTSRGGDPQEVCSAVASALQSRLGSKLPLQALIVVACAE